LFPNQNGQWCKKVKGKPYYFGRWVDDRKGDAALRDWVSRKDAILAGTDRLRVASHKAGLTLSQMIRDFL
jgi:hypothetical protein